MSDPTHQRDVDEGNRRISDWLRDHGHRELSNDRICGEEHDFREPEYLLLALAALRWDVEWCFYQKVDDDGFQEESGYNVQIADEEAIIGVASESELIRALWAALVCAVDDCLSD